MLALVAVVSAAPPATATPKTTEIVLTFGGDVCLQRSGWLPYVDGVGTAARRVPWSSHTAHIAPLLEGAELNFGNLEAVVTDRTDLSAQGKKYTFQMHVGALSHLTDIGMNLWSLANNHAYDFGAQGAKETFKHLKAFRKRGVHSAGLGLNDKGTLEADVFEVKGKRIAFIAVGIISNMNKRHRAGANKPGTLRFRDDKDYTRVLRAFEKVRADYKILSIHSGREREVALRRGQRARYHRALREAGVDLILGHHAHVVRGVERTSKGKLVFFGLGNYMMRGARNMGPFPDAQDYGLFGKIYLSVDPKTGRLEPQAVTVAPLTDMHRSARPMSPPEASRRINVLNALSLRTSGSEALTFRHDGKGWGQSCFGKRPGQRARKICQR